MREILFRGKRAKTGEWVTVFYRAKNLISGVNRLIYQARALDYYSGTEIVDPETVGQYTGHTDKHGTKIFEDDILRFYLDEGGYEDQVVVWDEEEHYGFSVKSEKGYVAPLTPSDSEYSEVIGNIYDGVKAE